jgi:hypothetical protein
MELYRKRLDLRGYGKRTGIGAAAPTIPSLPPYVLETAVSASAVDRWKANDPNTIHLSRKDVTITDLASQYELLVTVRPYLSDAQISRLSAEKFSSFAASFGRIRYSNFPWELRSIESNFDKVLSHDYHDRHQPGYPLQPEGDSRWTWIPPERPTDWRTRARTTFDKPATPPASLPELLLRTLLISGYRNATIDLHVGYSPRT